MDKDLNESDSQASQEGDNGQSLVGKLKKNVSEIISNTPLSKWFRKQNDSVPTSSVRRRQDDSDDEEDFYELQPPTKRTKLPPNKETLSLNVSELLSPISSVNNVKKPLYRNFPEPIPGPSGYQTRKMLNSTSILSEGNTRSTRTEGSESIFKNPKITAGANELIDKDSNSDSEESTSGYSSGRVGSKEIVSQESSKQTSPLENSPRKNRSLFQGTSSSRLFVLDHSLSPNRNSNLSSRMPSFNPSTFGSSSFVDRTLSTKRILNSPFYNGHTVYGGASAYGRSTRRATQDIQKVLRQSVKIKPVNKGTGKGDIQLGKTARRILDTLEQYSSPVSDAKKMPVAWKKNKTEGSLTKYIGANPYLLRESRSASNKELQVPSVTDLLKMKMDQQKSRLQDSTEAARQIAVKSNSVLNNESYQIPVQKEKGKHTTKIKTKITSVRHKVQIEETVPEFRLNPVALPIKELPKFDITVPPPAQKPLTTSSTVGTVVDKPISPFLPTKPLESTVENKLKSKHNSENKSDFKFSAPLVLAEYVEPLKALNNFKFSEPLVKKRRSIHPELDDQENKLDPKIKKNNGENLLSGLKQTGSWVDGISVKFKPKEGTWECTVCLIRNQPDKSKCAACETPKPKSKSSAAPLLQSFGSPITLKSSEGTWECPTCMIRNKENLQKCAACEEKKPDKSALNGIPKGPALTQTPLVDGDKAVFQNPSVALWECPNCHVKETPKFGQPHQCQKPKSVNEPANTSVNFGTKFSAPSNTWECSTCLIRNKDELVKCAACESPRPSKGGQSSQSNTLVEGFKKKTDEWECQVCMVRNKADAVKCVCCEASNSQVNTTSSTKVTSFAFGIDKNTASSFTFGIPPHLQSAPKGTLLLSEQQKESPAKSSEPPTFTFGIPAKDTKAESAKPIEKADSSKSTFNFGVQSKPAEAVPSKTPSVSFGTQPRTTEVVTTKSVSTFSVATTPKVTESAPSQSTAMFSFGAQPKTTEAAASKDTPNLTFGTLSKSEGANKATTTPTFSFGSTAKESTTSASTPTFNFTSGNKTDNKGNSSRTDREERTNPLLKPGEKLPEKAAVAPVGFGFGFPKGSHVAPVSSTTSFMPTKPSSIGESAPNKRSKPDDNESIPQAKIPTFSFKAPTTNGDIGKSASPFSKPDENKSVAGGFGFNLGSNKTTPAIGSNSAAVAPTFGSQADSSKQATSMFKFGSSSETTKQPNGFSFGSSAPAFGSKPNTAEAKPFSFGSSAPSTQTTPSFGATPPKMGMFSFGETTEKSPSFSFNAPSAAKTSNQFGSFGSATPKTQASVGFGQTAAPSFTFGASQRVESGFGMAPAPPNNPFGGGSNKPDSVFGAAPTQGSAVNGTFNFGAPATTNQKAGFSFGASSGASESNVAQGGFNFGSSAMNANAPAGSGGFNFSASATTFDANTKPSFNFTGGAGITAFSAPPSQEGTAPPRKIKKAVRRTVR